MAQATLSARIDPKDKYYFEEFCKSAGLSVSSAIGLFVKAVIKRQEIPFTISGDPFHSEENMDAIREALSEVKAGHYVVHEPIEVD